MDNEPSEERITVCGGRINPGEHFFEAEYNGRTYYLCARGCLRAFWSNPDDFLAGKIEHPINDE